MFSIDLLMLLRHSLGMFRFERVEEILNAGGHKKSWAARVLGVSPNTFTRYLKGETSPSRGDAHLLARALRIDPRQLWDEQDQQPPKPAA